MFQLEFLTHLVRRVQDYSRRDPATFLTPPLCVEWKSVNLRQNGVVIFYFFLHRLTHKEVTIGLTQKKVSF
jgi:hypothetical protein